MNAKQMLGMVMLLFGVQTNVSAFEPNRGPPPQEYTTVNETAAPSEMVETFYHPEGRQPTWYLGVATEMTINGCRVVYVVQNSPAWFLGLEAGDYITAVDGFRVGVIDRQGYPIYSELRRTSNGWIKLHITDGKNKQQYADVAVKLALQQRRRF